jgi:hypothetical protein
MTGFKPLIGLKVQSAATNYQGAPRGRHYLPTNTILDILVVKMLTMSTNLALKNRQKTSI